MWSLARKLANAGYRIKLVGYRSMRHNPQQIVESVRSKITACCAERSGKIHFVGYSLGGLIVRAYLARYMVPNLGRVVLVGTPNNGTPFVDHYRDEWWFKMLGPTARFLGTNKGSLPRSLPRPHYPVGVIAGKSERGSNEDVLPGDDDGLVTVASTKLKGMTDFVIVQSGHSAMRYNADVAKQVVSFLKSGQFHKDSH